MGRVRAPDGQLMPPVDVIHLRCDWRHVEPFARNWQGLHVPLSTMSITQRHLAHENRHQFKGEKCTSSG